MDINCTSTKTPVVSFLPNTSSALYYPNCQFIVEVNDTYSEVAFTVGLSLNASTYIYLEKGFLKGKINTVNITDLQVLQTAIGPINSSQLKNFFNFAFSVGLPIINTKIFQDTGIELPSVSGLSFKDTDLFVKQGFVELDMNPLFDNTTSLASRINKYLR